MKLLDVALAGYQPQVQRKVDILIQQLLKRQDQSVDITQWATYFTFDVMGEVAFGRDFKQLDDAAEHFAISALHAQMDDIGFLGAVPWLMHLLICIPGLRGPYEIFKRYTVDQVERRKAVCEGDIHIHTGLKLTYPRNGGKTPRRHLRTSYPGC